MKCKICCSRLSFHDILHRADDIDEAALAGCVDHHVTLAICWINDAFGQEKYFFEYHHVICNGKGPTTTQEGCETAKCKKPLQLHFWLDLLFQFFWMKLKISEIIDVS